MERASFVVKGFTRVSDASAAIAEGCEVLSCLGHDITKESECNTSSRFAIDLHIEEASVSDSG